MLFFHSDLLFTLIHSFFLIVILIISILHSSFSNSLSNSYPCRVVDEFILGFSLTHVYSVRLCFLTPASYATNVLSYHADNIFSNRKQAVVIVFIEAIKWLLSRNISWSRAIN